MELTLQSAKYSTKYMMFVSFLDLALSVDFQFELKAVTDKNVTASEYTVYVVKTVENIVGEREHIGQKHFLYFPYFVQKPCLSSC